MSEERHNTKNEDYRSANISETKLNPFEIES